MTSWPIEKASGSSQALVVRLETPYAVYEPKVAAAREVVIMGLQWDTPSWPDLAVGWLEQGLPVDAEIAECLQLIVERGDWPQRLRHRAERLVRAWRRTQ